MLCLILHQIVCIPAISSCTENPAGTMEKLKQFILVHLKQFVKFLIVSLPIFWSIKLTKKSLKF